MAHPSQIPPGYDQASYSAYIQSLQSAYMNPAFNFYMGGAPPVRKDLDALKTEVCRYWRFGMCARAEGCFYKHDPNYLGIDRPGSQGVPLATSLEIPGVQLPPSYAERVSMAAAAAGIPQPGMYTPAAMPQIPGMDPATLAAYSAAAARAAAAATMPQIPTAPPPALSMMSTLSSLPQVPSSATSSAASYAATAASPCTTTSGLSGLLQIQTRDFALPAGPSGVGGTVPRPQFFADYEAAQPQSRREQSFHTILPGTNPFSGAAEGTTPGPFAMASQPTPGGDSRDEGRPREWRKDLWQPAGMLNNEVKDEAKDESFRRDGLSRHLVEQGAIRKRLQSRSRRRSRSRDRRR